ncbi:MAG: transposase [Pirellulales bacterium]|nr:transposase [Pirellulales bacterium]
MPRTARIAPGGMVFHVLNRANARARIFAKEADYAAFEQVMKETLSRMPMRILGYLIMPNHWHLVLWPENDGELSAFMQRLTTTHVRRWHLHRKTVGCGHLYQGTYKSFPIETDEHLLTVLGYVERNALRAGLVERAEDWRWSSLWRWQHAEVTEDMPPLAPWPVERPRQWLLQVNRPQPQAELEAVQTSIQRGRPFGSAIWQALTAEKLGLESTFQPRGRPRKSK